MLLAEIARGRCHDCLLTDYNFAVLLERLPHVIFTDEIRYDC